MIRHRRHMGTYRRYRVTERGTVLDSHTVYRIRIITAPDLRCVIQHACVEPSASSAAAFNQHIRIALHQALQEIIYPKNIIMKHSSLVLCNCGINIRQTAVLIPFHIFNIALVQHTAYFFKNIIHNILPGEIQHQLISTVSRFSSRYGKCPVRMLPVQIAVFGNHLRLNPDTEFYAQSIDSSNQFSKCTSELLLVDRPVPETAIVIVTFAKPSVVHDYHLDSNLFGMNCKVINRLSGKIKISCLPAVYQDWPYLFFVLSAAYMFADAGMQILRQTIETFMCIGQNYFRRNKALSLVKRIRKLFIVKPKKHSCQITLIFFRLSLKITTIHKGQSIAASRCFRC